MEHRGRNMKDVELVNRDLVKEFFKKNPDGMFKEAESDTGLSAPTVRRHRRHMLKEAEVVS